MIAGRVFAPGRPALLALVLLASAGTWYAVHAASAELEGLWECPTQLYLGATGPSAMPMHLTTRSHLRPNGRYASEGEALVMFGQWPLTLAGTSDGRWQREDQKLTLTIESIELSPGSDRAVELQRYLIQQLRPMLPELPHTEIVRIMNETPERLVLEDDFGEQFTCTRP